MTERIPIDLKVRTYRGEADNPAIAALQNAAALVDGAETGRTAEEIGRRLAGPTVHAEENVFLVEARGQPVAWGWVEFEQGPEEGVFFFRGLVHPEWRRRGIGTMLMERLEARSLERLKEASALRVYASAASRLEHEGPQALCRSLGYEIARYFSNMERSLRQDGVALELPAPVRSRGIKVRTMAQRPALEEVWRATDEAFRDHWGHTDTVLEQWEHWVEDPDHRPELWFLAWDEERDQVAGVCLSGIDPARNERTGRQEGWVHVLAVRRPYRGQGLGRALLLQGMAALQDAGMDYAMLGVDTENLTGALRLYESAGFAPSKKMVLFRKALRGS